MANWTTEEFDAAVALCCCGLSHKEIGRKVGRTERAVSMKLNRAGYRPRLEKLARARELLGQGLGRDAVLAGSDISLSTYKRLTRRTP